MKERPILFTPDNIRATREGRKTQTRRVIKPQPESNPQGGALVPLRPPCPYGYIGDRLWVKEGVIVHCGIPELIGYYMDGCRATEHWMERRTAMFMPKWAARTWLKITGVKLERVQDISECDAAEEGTGVWFETHPHEGWDGDPDQYRKGYRELWDSINGLRYNWLSNPWVWCIEFRRVTWPNGTE